MSTTPGKTDFSCLPDNFSSGIGSFPTILSMPIMLTSLSIGTNSVFSSSIDSKHCIF